MNTATNSAALTPALPVDQAALSRVSVRRYADIPVSHDEVRRVVELAGKAPSAFNVQPWRFIAVTDPETKARLQEAAFNQPQVGAAPVVLVLTSDMEDVLSRVEELVHPGLQGERRERAVENLRTTFGGMEPEARTAWGRNQANIALGYLLLVLESLGYGSSPMLGFDPVAVRSLLGIPAHAEIPAIVAFGRPAEEGFSQYRLPVDDILRFV